MRAKSAACFVARASGPASAAATSTPSATRAMRTLGARAPAPVSTATLLDEPVAQQIAQLRAIVAEPPLDLALRARRLGEPREERSQSGRHRAARGRFAPAPRQGQTGRCARRRARRRRAREREPDGAVDVVRGVHEQPDHARRDDRCRVEHALDRAQFARRRAATLAARDDQAGEAPRSEWNQRAAAGLRARRERCGHRVAEQRIDRNRQRDLDDRSRDGGCRGRARHARIVLSRAMGERIRIRETKRGRALEIDGTFASWWSHAGEATGSVWDALVAPLLALPPARRRSVLLLGLGGGSVARLVRAIAPSAQRRRRRVRSARSSPPRGAISISTRSGSRSSATMRAPCWCASDAASTW